MITVWADEDEDGGVEGEDDGDDDDVEDDGGHLAREISHPSLLCGESGIKVGIEEGVVEAEEVVDVVCGVGEGGGVGQEEKQEQDGEAFPLKAHCTASLLRINHQPM